MLPTPLRYKIGQMLIMGFDGTSIHKDSPIYQTLQSDTLGGVLLFDYNLQSNTFDKNILNPTQVRSLNQALQAANHQAAKTHDWPGLPLIIAVDYEGGKVNRLKETCGFPPTLTAAQVGLLQDEERFTTASAMAHTLSDLGFNLDFAPVVDLNSNPDNPIMGQLDRCFSTDPQHVADCARSYTKAFRAHHILSSYKHFPGHGSSQGDSHLGFVDVTDTWQASELVPYESLVKEHSTDTMVMTAHIVNRHLDPTGLPATLSKVILTDLLRNQLKFKGVIITDDMQMKAIADHYDMETAITLAINAGADMLIFGNQLSDTPEDPNSLIDYIESQVRSGLIEESMINQAYERIVVLKSSLRK